MDCKIFGPYANGAGQEVYADPLAADMDLRELLGCTPNAVITETQSPDPRVWIGAKRKLLSATRAVFGLAPFDPATGTGAADSQVLDVWNQWAAYQTAQKKSTELLRPSATVDLSPSPMTVSPTKSASGCGCT